MANGTVTPVRPDAMPENPEARQTNPFKQALNVLLYGSRDPSYVDIGEARAKGVFQHNIGTGQALAAGARPEVAAQIMAAYGNNAAQAAQAMRERYYQKEHQQMIELQVKPQVEKFQAVATEAKGRVEMFRAPIPRTIGLQEGAGIAISDQLSKPAPPEVVPNGTNAEGKASSKVIQGLAPPSPNPALMPGQVGGIDLSYEDWAFLDPVTGQPVAITSQRGREIERQATSDLMSAHNSLMTGLMDTFAQYPGNPFAADSMKKILDGVINQSGVAVTGRSGAPDQAKWMQEWDQKQAEIENSRADYNKKVFELEEQHSQVVAKASDAVQQAQEDPEFAALLGRKAQKNIEQGIPVEEWDDKTLRNTAALGSQQRDLQLKDLEANRAAGLVRIEPRELKLPDTWHSRLQVRDEGYRHRLAQEYARMQEGIMSQIAAFPRLSEDEKTAVAGALGIPQDIQGRLSAGLFTDPSVQTWLEQKIKGTDEYRQAQTRTYMDTLTEIFQQQPEVHESVLASNEQFIQDWVDQALDDGKSQSYIKDNVARLRADTLGTHILATEHVRPPAYRPPVFHQKLQDEYFSQKRSTPEQRAQARDAARQEIRDPNAPVLSSVEPAATRSLTAEQVFRGEGAKMSQEQLEYAIEALETERSNLLPSFTGGATTNRARKALDERINELKKHHQNWLDRAVQGVSEAKQGLLMTIHEERERKEKERIRREKLPEQLLQVLKVN